MRRVAERHGDIAQPALVADAIDGRAAHALVELGGRPGEELGQSRRIEAVPHLEIGVARGPRELVPRADELAVIASINAVADRRAEFDRNRAGVLDGQIRDASPRIEPVRRDDGARRAGRDARLARAAVGARRGIGRQRQVRQDLSEKEPRARIARKEVGVLADPAEARRARERLLEYGRAVDTHAITERADASRKLLGEPGERPPHDLVIIAAERIAGDVAALAVPQRLHRVARLLGPVVHAHTDRAYDAGHELRRAAALDAVAGHIAHLAVKACREPVLETALVLGDLDAAHAECIEAELARTCAQLSLERLKIELDELAGRLHRASIING